MSKPYTPKMDPTWWLRRTPYFLFMVRELTAVFIAAYCVILLLGLSAVKTGAGAYTDFLDDLRTPWAIAFHVVALVFAAYHSITWFNLTPKALVVRVGENRVPGVLIAGANYVAWAVVSAVLLWIVFR